MPTLSAGARAERLALAEPALSVTKAGALLADADGDGLADPGDALRYTIVVANSGTTDALGVVVSDTLDANTILSGTVRASPLAVTDVYTTTLETTLVVNPSTGLLANDFGLPAPIVELPPGLPVVATAQGGSATLATNGSFQYVPPADYVGPDSFTYTAYNASGSAPGQVALMVLDVPVARDDVYATTANAPLVVPGGTGVLANDTPNFSAISAYAHVSAQGGSVSLAADGSFSYTPPVDFFSPPADTFTYTLSNDAGADTATALITVNLPGSPLAVNDVYTTTANAPRTVAAPGVLVNDTPNLGAITAYARTSARGGSVTLSANGGFTYIPPADTVSPPTDTFTYTVSNALGSSTATVSFTLYPPDPPAAANDAYDATAGEALGVAAPGVLGNDAVNFATITGYQVVTSRGGSVTLNANGSFSYTPPDDFVSPPTDTFTYTLSNMLGADTGLVTLTIFPDGPPLAANDLYTTTVNMLLTVPAPGLLGNDNLNFGQLAGYAATTARGGTVVIAASGAFTYTPPPNTVRPPNDSFTYTLTNTVGADTATVFVRINPEGPPAAVNDAYIATANTPLSVSAGSGVLANDTRNYGTITAYDDETARGGSVSLNPGGSFTYTPPDDEVSPPDDSFSYTLANVLGTDSATVTITILPPWSPVAANDAYTATAGVARVVPAPGVLGNDTRNFGTITSYQASTSRGGSVTLNANGSFSYMPPAGFVSPPTDTFTYTLSNMLGADTGLVMLTVYPSGPPLAANDLYTTTVNMLLTVPAPGLFGNDTLNFGQLAGYAATTARGGTLTVGPAGGFTYTPPPNVVRPPNDSFTYTVTNTVGSDTAMVSIAINPAGLPSAANDAYTATANTLLDVPPGSGVLVNDTLNFGAIAAYDAATVRGGSVSLGPDGAFTYMPPAGVVSPPADSFRYTLANVLGADSATVTITILPASAPVTVGDAYDATAGSTLNVPAPGVLDNDTLHFGALTPFSGTTSQGGSVTLNVDGSFSYTPPAGFISPPADSFSYTLANALGSSIGTVSLTVLPEAGRVVGLPGGTKTEARAAAAQAHDLAADAAVVSVGRLPADRSVTIVFDAVLANPLLPGAREIVNQAEVAGGNFGPLRSDDPSTPDANDATITQLDGLSAERQYLPVVMRSHATGPDLVGSFSLSPDQSAYSPGQPVAITVVITNVGTIRAGAIWVDFYFNPSSPPTQAGQVWDSLCALSPCYGLAWQVTAALAPGQSVTLSSAPGSYYGPNSNWPGYFASGTSDLYLFVDSYSGDGSPTGLVVETNEGNNRAERHGLSVP